MTTLPAARFSPLRGGPLLRWGILAPGAIAADWVRTVLANTDQRVVAVASRSAERAEVFAREHGIARAYGGYELLLADDTVDIVYIAAPHSEHRRLALAAIAAGKHVLVEKPIALNAAEARDIADAARSAGVFAMEAMKARFLPQTDVIGRLLRDGVLGDIVGVEADFGSRATFDPTSRLFDPVLGGGALLDIGVYPLWFAHFVLGRPRTIGTTGSLAPSGVDEHAVVTLDYAARASAFDGSAAARAVITTSLIEKTPHGASIRGSRARLEVIPPFQSPTGLRVIANDTGEVTEFRDTSGLSGREGMAFQVTAAAAAIADGLTESPLHTLDDAIAVLEVVDAARAQLGAVRLG
jgi:predicted dehydrogenase